MSKFYFILILLICYTVIVYFFSTLGRKREIGFIRLFLISFFLTPVMGLAFLLSSQERKLNMYLEKSYKCDRCKYIFSEEFEYCPFCEKEGVKQELKPVLKQMT